MFFRNPFKVESLQLKVDYTLYTLVFL